MPISRAGRDSLHDRRVSNCLNGSFASNNSTKALCAPWVCGARWLSILHWTWSARREQRPTKNHVRMQVPVYPPFHRKRSGRSNMAHAGQARCLTFLLAKCSAAVSTFCWCLASSAIAASSRPSWAFKPQTKPASTRPIAWISVCRAPPSSRAPARSAL